MGIEQPFILLYSRVWTVSLSLSLSLFFHFIFRHFPWIGFVSRLSGHRFNEIGFEFRSIVGCDPLNASLLMECIVRRGKALTVSRFIKSRRARLLNICIFRWRPRSRDRSERHDPFAQWYRQNSSLREPTLFLRNETNVLQRTNKLPVRNDQRASKWWRKNSNLVLVYARLADRNCPRHTTRSLRVIRNAVATRRATC